MTGMTEAGFESVFIGIESPSVESLLETRKNQNVKGSIVDRVHEVLRHGLDVWAGFIVGFDSDGPDIFDRQIEVIEAAAIPFAMVGVLHALPGTPLESRLREAGRMRSMESMDQFGRTNFDTRLPEAVLLGGYRRILQAVYEPRQYFDRVLEMLRHKRQVRSRARWLRPRHVAGALRAVAAQGVVAHYRFDYWRFLWKVLRSHRSRFAEALVQAAAGHHFIEYTRRVVLPRLAEPASSPILASQAMPETGFGAGRG
jgi:radical SAM superfamily enzyme YgiQ (UPF0313 family)